MIVIAQPNATEEQIQRIVTRVREFAERKHDDITSLDAAYAEIHRDHPFHDAPDFVGSLRRLMEQPDFKSILELN